MIENILFYISAVMAIASIVLKGLEVIKDHTKSNWDNKAYNFLDLTLRFLSAAVKQSEKVEIEVKSK
jgi:hypothetical protein